MRGRRLSRQTGAELRPFWAVSVKSQTYARLTKLLQKAASRFRNGQGETQTRTQSWHFAICFAEAWSDLLYQEILEYLLSQKANINKENSSQRLNPAADEQP